MSETWIWDRYWHFDRIASCCDGAGASNYDDSVAAGWRAFFGGLPEGARILDLCTGNGAAALIAAGIGRRGAKGFEIVAVDQADIDPPAHVTRHAEDLAAIAFAPRTEVEALPFPDGRFDAAISQYGIEYSDLARSLPEAVRVLAPGGRLRFVVHAADGDVAAGARTVIAEADQLLGEIDLAGRASRCFEALWAVERAGDEAARPRADAAFAAFQEALAETARRIPQAHDPTMFRNSGAVLLDTFQRRGHFDLDQLLAKVGDIDTEIRAHRGRLVALVEAALDAAQAEALAERLRRAGADRAGSTPLMSGAELIGHIVEARF
ncbi:MAG TPA: methyltransferase domain-containing protein [Allosphingosinicella sp.]|nr:methyltransferase domain-containing protein [Allosphingosinicella sp.]